MAADGIFFKPAPSSGAFNSLSCCPTPVAGHLGREQFVERREGWE
jgi:hypothetical protein